MGQRLPPSRQLDPHFQCLGIRSRTSGAYGAVFGVFLAQKFARQAFHTSLATARSGRLSLRDATWPGPFTAAATTDRANEAYNLGTGTPQSVNRLVELLGGGNFIHLPKRPGEPDCTWADISKIRAELGWEPLVSFEDGVGRMLENIDYWKQAPVWDEKSIAEATSQWFKYLKN